MPEGLDLPPLLGVLALRDQVLFPMALLPLIASDEGEIRLVDDAMRTHRQLAAVTVRAADAPRPARPEDLHRIGCAAVVHQLHRAPDGGVRYVVQGLERIRLEGFTRAEPYIVARVVAAPPIEVPGAEAEALSRTVKDLFREVVALSSTLPDELGEAAAGLEDVRALSYLVAASVPFSTDARQELLQAEATPTLLRRLVELLQHELAVLQVQQHIRSETVEQISKSQREHVLREQMRAIQRELGEGDPAAAEVRELRRRAEGVQLPAEARAELDRELKRLEQMFPGSPEQGMVRTWLDWMLALPWSKLGSGAIDLAAASRVLDEDHYDLEKVKDLILDHLAVRKLRRDREAQASRSGTGDAGPAANAGPAPQKADDESRREPILCFVGPPGVGKTSLGQSVARAMERRFVRLSLGGIQDEAEIRGHRRTYIGAMPGRIIQAIRRADALDPVMMLDEVDKLAASYHGDPAAALLEVLDPAQNHAFTDSYLGLPFDLSRVLFICTANTTESIPGPLLDRMELIALSGYTETEKLHIARRYLVPKALRAAGLAAAELEIDDAGLTRVVREYTREAGVRGLERAIAAIARKAARRIGEGAAGPVRVGAPDVPQLLGRPRFLGEMAERIDRPGVATGLAWTPAGGDVLFVEAAMMPGEEKLILTGMMGDVMRESAQAAVTFLRSNASRLGLEPRAFQGRTIHVHVPAGAIPKDGPSAGVAIMTAVASVAADRPVRNDTAMTGEITLRGKVLPVGGIREKALAAYRSGVKQVVLPLRNEGDVEDVPREVREALRFVVADSAEDVLRAALGIEARGARAAVAEPPAPPAVH